MKEGDVLLFIGGNNLVDNVERLETHSKFTHAALAVNESEFIEAWWNGVRRNNLDSYKNRNKNIIVFTPITPLSESQQAQIIEYALGKIGEPSTILNY
ncbi:MAG TPA: hypothetical protein DD730_16535 [Desulfosporosinus sp.]|jgi:uncharacterized protein YycO|nr:hypothetical protein [Desulfosporosinus sp.]